MRRTTAAAPIALPGSQRTTLQTLSSLLPYLWPKDDLGARVRASLAALFLVISKVANVCVPLIYAAAVDALIPKGANPLITVPTALIVGYGILRITSSGFGEMRDAIFAAGQQRTVRRIALQTCPHRHRLS